jgi:putative oxidoreductase
MRRLAISLLRASLGLLMVWWGVDKLVNTGHAQQVSDFFYFGLFSAPLLLQVFGIVQIAFGVLVILGLFRKWTALALVLVTGATMIGVWRSIIDPWGFVLEGANVLFFPSLIIFAASLVLYALHDADQVALGSG